MASFTSGLVLQCACRIYLGLVKENFLHKCAAIVPASLQCDPAKHFFCKHGWGASVCRALHCIYIARCMWQGDAPRPLLLARSFANLIASLPAIARDYPARLCKKFSFTKLRYILHAHCKTRPLVKLAIVSVKKS